jgi:FAD dependent oxidoreductase TIGR03364
MSKPSAIVIGAGIVGLATARALSLKGFQVTVIERNEQAVGASIRNFGMLWPIGQPDGPLYQRATRSRQIWKEVADSVGLWYDPVGSLHLAHEQDEWEVLQELYHSFGSNGREVQLMDKQLIAKSFNGVNENGLKGGLFSSSEMIIDPREAIAAIPNYLSEYLDVSFIWNTTITDIRNGKLRAGSQVFQADLVFVCSGPDFETLYPDEFAKAPLTKCKLQMMRFLPENNDWRIGTSLCGGLSLIHYPAFKAAPSLQALKNRYAIEMEEYLKWGIHVMVSQNDKGELTVGDSHEYGLTFDPFDKARLNQLILEYLRSFALTSNWKLVQSWHGIYPKLTNGEAHLILQPENQVTILNGLGGNGMTLSFGLAEEVVSKL